MRRARLRAAPSRVRSRSISQAKPLADDGKVRPLAVASPARIPAWPDVPTFKELGYDIDFRGFVGLSAPVKTPKPIVEYPPQAPQ